jgi:hypothetical protein
MQILFDRNSSSGLTVRQLRHLLGTIGEADSDGNEAVVFLAVGNCHCSITSVAAVDDDGDLVLISDFAQEIMNNCETWDQFISDDA